MNTLMFQKMLAEKSEMELVEQTEKFITTQQTFCSYPRELFFLTSQKSIVEKTKLHGSAQRSQVKCST